ncbi:hypothetical protein DPMN_114198 [Dreissena polymorpha]|uniref:Uncharacterized protein n=1 Tax=Dreissena polymorpha TaxID=45954 RepID=A0A9D4KIY1_DREPO|nr:hypothetical protein DPMN_114198 [Dreissena polymorpha]
MTCWTTSRYALFPTEHTHHSGQCPGSAEVLPAGLHHGRLKLIQNTYFIVDSVLGQQKYDLLDNITEGSSPNRTHTS